MGKGAFEKILSDVDGHVSSAIASLIASPSAFAEYLLSLEQAAQLMAALSKSKQLPNTPQVSCLLNALSDRTSRAETLLETVAAFHMGCLNAHAKSTGDYSPSSHHAYSICSPSLVRVEG